MTGDFSPTWLLQHSQLWYAKASRFAASAMCPYTHDDVLYYIGLYLSSQESHGTDNLLGDFQLCVEVQAEGGILEHRCEAVKKGKHPVFRRKDGVF